MQGGVVRRPATEADRELLFDLHRACFRDVVERIWGWDEPFQRERFDAALGSGRREVLTLGSEPIGAIEEEQRVDHVFLAYLAILPAHQGRGLGTRLVRETLERARAQGRPLRLSVLRGNRALSLYLRLGFRIVAEDEHRLRLEAAARLGPNVFDSEWVAARFARHRPDVHTRVAERVARRTGANRIDLAVDVGCGTGHSTRAFEALARRSLGVDPSRFMLAHASAAGGASFVVGRAEALPVGDEQVDLMTMAQAWHWCEREALLAEVGRVLRSEGWLIVYDSYLSCAEPFSEWLFREFVPRLPVPPRNAMPDPQRFADNRLELIHHEILEQRITMTLDRLVAFLTTQSGVAAAVDGAGASPVELEHVLTAGLAPHFVQGSREIGFTGPILYFRRSKPMRGSAPERS